MWPKRGEAVNRTIEAEAVLTDLWAEVLNQWAPTLPEFVLPVLTAAADPPPDPNAVSQNSAALEALVAELIVTGLAALWCLSIVEAAAGLGIVLPGLPELGTVVDRPALDPRVMRVITRTSSVTKAEVNRALDVVESTHSLREARNEFVESQRTEVNNRIETLVRDKVAMAVREAETDTKRIAPAQTESPGRSAPAWPKRAGDTAPAPVPDEAPAVEVVIERQREAAASVLTPGSEELRDIARQGGYGAAGVQNAAVVEATRYADPDEELEKCWIATMDGRTRDTHFAADGQRAPLTGTFTVGGAHLRYPADPDGPPEETRNCRCRVGVLAVDEELPDEIDRHTERGPGNATVRNREGSQADEIERRKDKGVVRARDDVNKVGQTAAATPEVTMAKKLTADGATTMAAAEAETEENSESETFRTFTDQPIAFVGIETSDGRMLAKDIEFSVRTPPLPMMWTKKTGYGHMDAFTVGVIESARIDGDKVLGSGYMLNTAEADEAFNEAGHKVSRPSVDLGAVEWILTYEGKEITEEDWWDLPPDAKVVQTITAAELIGTTLVATPAFGDTMLEFNDERESRDLALVASTAVAFEPRVYAAELFASPNLTEPTPITIDPATGRIFGHLACFGACHRSLQSQCVMAPRSKTEYAHFHTSPAVRLDNGSRVAVGRLTVGTGHAPDSLSGGPALAHYDNTGTCFALVRVGEDAHGIWFSGVAAPWATPEQIEEGLASPLSGDWRDFGQGLELIAALAVNTPGFAVRGRDGADGRPAALVASLGPSRGKRRDDVQITAEAIGSIVEASVQRALAASARKTKADELVAAAVAKVGPPPAPKTRAEEVDDLIAQATGILS